MNSKANKSGRVYDRLDRLCLLLLAFDANVPVKYRRSLWEPLRMYADQAQAFAEMAYLENDPEIKFALIKDARKSFRIFVRYHTRCEMTGEFRFGRTLSLDIAELTEDIEYALARWSASQHRLLVGGGAAAAAPRAPGIELKRSEEGHSPASE